MELYTIVSLSACHGTAEFRGDEIKAEIHLTDEDIARIRQIAWDRFATKQAEIARQVSDAAPLQLTSEVEEVEYTEFEPAQTTYDDIPF